MQLAEAYDILDKLNDLGFSNPMYLDKEYFVAYRPNRHGLSSRVLLVVVEGEVFVHTYSETIPLP